MASPQLPTPGRLILDNITLLAGSPTTFHTRYGFTLTPTTFAKPGNTAPANAVLHFLISIIDADVAESLFKPCFPILDRDQERDFRKVVDARLAILERTKLLPVGSARKSVVAAAGGDRFLDLLWSLSSLAVQQACLRHPAYGSVSRIRLLSHQNRSDTASQHSASRSSRSLLSGLAPRPDRSPADPSRHRRFLGVGMLSASQQRYKDAEEMRARIDSERIALTRTTEMGQHGAKTWSSEADSLREKIGDFEAKLRRLKGQLADMGFDENGLDIRANAEQKGDPAATGETKPITDSGATGGRLVASSSGDDLRDELKTSPIESTESCSSVDDTGDACDDLAVDLSRLLTFTVESHDQREDVDHAIDAEKPVIPFATVTTTDLKESEATVERSVHCDPTGILHLVRVATNELEEVTNRMHEIRKARQRAGIDESVEVEADGDAKEESNARLVPKGENRTEEGVGNEKDGELIEETDSQVAPRQLGDNVSENKGQSCPVECLQEPVPSPTVENAGSSLDVPAPLEQKVSRILEEHNVVVESSRRLQNEAATLSAKAAPLSTLKVDSVSADSSSPDSFVDAISKPHWYTTAAANSTKAKKNTAQNSATRKHGKPPRGGIVTLTDVSVAAKAMQGHTPSQALQPSSSRRRKEGTKSLDSFNLYTNLLDKGSPTSSRNDLDALYSPSESSSSLKGTPRSVRFAELPPSYSASRTSDDSREGSPVRNGRSSDEHFAERVSKALEGRREEKYPSARDMNEPVVVSEDDHNVDGECQARGERNGVMSKKTSRPSRKSEGMRQNDTHATKGESGRNGAVSSQKPPRVQRTRTPHRVMSSKDTMQRSVASRPHRSTKSQPPRPFSSRSASLDSISSLRRSRSSTISSQAVDEELLGVEVESTRVEEIGLVSDPSKKATKEVLLENEYVNYEAQGLQASDEETAEDISATKKEPVQKKLFLTPESAVSSSKATRHLSRLGGRKQDFARMSSAGILHSSNRGNVSEACEVTAVVKDSSVEFPSADEDELLFSPAAKPPLPQKLAQPKVGTGGGFFAGQTAEWQQSVRAQSNADRQTAVASARGLSESSGRLGRSSGKTSSSGMRSRVQSFRARLAALK